MKNFSKLLKYSGILLTLAFSFDSIAAETSTNCTPIPSCADLGYAKTVAECNNEGVRCPWDSNKMYCPYTPVPCTIGSILYEDKKCYEISPKMPIAVVFNPDTHFALALETKLANIVEAKNTTIEIPVLSGITSNDGRKNTQIIMNYIESSSGNIRYPAVEFAATYSTPGTNAGDWFLPSFDEMTSIIELYNENKLDKFSQWLENQGLEPNAIYFAIVGLGITSTINGKETQSVGLNQTGGTLPSTPAIYY